MQELDTAAPPCRLYCAVHTLFHLVLHVSYEAQLLVVGMVNSIVEESVVLHIRNFSYKNTSLQTCRAACILFYAKMNMDMASRE